MIVPGLVAFTTAQEKWLTWSVKQAEAVGKAGYVRGRVGGALDMRLLKTERAYNYKLAATWLTPEVIRASARLLQLAGRLTDLETQALVIEAEQIDGTVIMVEIDPREGSGVIPNDWTAFFRPVVERRVGRPIRGTSAPRLREVRALGGVLRRNYDYDRFWAVFPLKHDDGSPSLPSGTTGAELIVRIYDREGTVQWPLPQGFQAR